MRCEAMVIHSPVRTSNLIRDEWSRAGNSRGISRRVGAGTAGIVEVEDLTPVGEGATGRILLGCHASTSHSRTPLLTTGFHTPIVDPVSSAAAWAPNMTEMDAQTGPPLSVASDAYSVTQ